MNLKVGDKVVVIAGASKGKEGKITKTLKKVLILLRNIKRVMDKKLVEF